MLPRVIHHFWKIPLLMAALFVALESEAQPERQAAFGMHAHVLI
jgi:hypothetical protein